ncbi:MAG TPA: hypothetical protein VGO40_16345 [Longimicrobium sp.]|jgi:hypothetical protein|nr:hypothetical protein [Longimicrobium sp.]
MARTREEQTQQQLDLSTKSLRMRGDGSAIHLGMVVSFGLVAALPFVLDRFSGSGTLALAVVLATLVLIAFVVDRVAPRNAKRGQHRPFRSNARPAKIPVPGRRAVPSPNVDPPTATRTRNGCRKAS